MAVKEGNKNKRNFGKGKQRLKPKQGKKTNKTKVKNVEAAGNQLQKKRRNRPKYSKWSQNTTGSKKGFESPDEKLVLTGEWLKMSRQRLAERYSKTVIVTMTRGLRLDEKDLERFMKDTLSIKFRIDEKASYVYLEYESPFDAKMKIKQFQTLTLNGQKVTAEISSDAAPSAVNPYILYVDYIPAEATFKDVQTAFPTASHIKVKLGYRSDLARKSAILLYEDKNVAGQVFEHADNIEVKDTKVAVTFIKYAEPHKRSEPKKRSSDETTAKEEPKAKKAKVGDGQEIQQEVEGKSPEKKNKKKKKTGKKDSVKVEAEVKEIQEEEKSPEEKKKKNKKAVENKDNIKVEAKEKEIQEEEKSPEGKKKKKGKKRDSNGVETDKKE